MSGLVVICLVVIVVLCWLFGSSGDHYDQHGNKL